MSENTRGPEPTPELDALAQAAYFSCDTAMLDRSFKLITILRDAYSITDFRFLCGVCYAAGRVDGIREERAKKRGQTDA